MTVSDPGVARALAVPARASIVRLLGGADRPRTVEEIAEAVGLHVSTVRGHLDLLVGVGLVRRAGVRRVGRGRPRVLYTVPTGDAGEDGYRRLAEMLAAELESVATDPARAALHAGERWAAVSAGGALAAHPDGDAEEDLARVTGLLERLGFRPARTAGGGPVRPAPDDRTTRTVADDAITDDAILLRRCPFEAAARRNPMIVCGVHLGLLRAAFERLGGRVWVDTLDAFVDDEYCVVRVRRTRSGEPLSEGI